MYKAMQFNLQGKIRCFRFLSPLIRRVMKLTCMLLFVAFLQVSANSYSQNVNISVKNASLEKVFSLIEHQTGYFFFYKFTDLKTARPVSVKIDNGSVSQAILLSLKDQPYTFSVDDENKMIVIKKAVPAAQQTAVPPKNIRGQVTDEKGAPLPGATIKVKGTTLTALTNTNGEFTLNGVEDNAVLTVTFIGYISQDINTATSTVVNIKMVEDIKSLESVVVVGYGTQKKINLTGAVDQVGSEYFEDRPMPSITRGLQGVLPNLNLKINDGKPIRGAAYNIRGSTSIGQGTVPNALVLIDGVTGDPENLNPNDVESVTILKDAASAAIYGSRAAFGVVLITTKSAKAGKTTVNHSSSYSNNRRTTTPNLITDGYTWATNYDESLYAWMDYSTHPVNINGLLSFSQAYLDELKKHQQDPSLPNWGVDASGNYQYFASTDWMKEMYRPSNASMEHTISVSSGTDKLKLNLSGRYYMQDGIFRYNPDKLNKYNIRAKVDMKISNYFSVNANLDFSTMDYRYPLTSQGGVNAVWRMLSNYGFPVVPLLNPDGSLTNIASYSIGDFYEGKSFSNMSQTTNRYTIGFTALPLKHVTLKGDFTYINNPTGTTSRYFPDTYSIKPGVITSAGLNYLQETNEYQKTFNSNLYADYTNKFGKHSLKVLLGANQESYSDKTRNTRRDGLIVDNIVDFNLATGTNYILTGGGNEWSTAGVFSRVNYSYNDRYLFEFDGRYDGSSRFPQTQQWGFFPSASAGWIISREPFMAKTNNWLPLLKVRASYGSLGNGNITPYSFVPAIAVGTSTVLQNGAYPNYIQQPAPYADNITWEKATTVNLGLDVGLFQDQLTASLDVYQRRTTNMITVGPPLPLAYGAAVPKGNNADLKTNGFELSLSWNSTIGTNKPLRYGFRLTVSDYIATVTKFYNPTNLLNTYYPGYKLGQIMGFQTLGFYKDAADIANSPNQKNYFVVSNGNNILPGDIKFADLNGDGFVNIGKNTLQDPGDQKVIGNTSPRLPFGFTGDLAWNNFSFSYFFQGVMKRDWMPSPEANFFWGMYNRPYSVMPAFNQNRWTPENPSQDAYFPRYRAYVALSGTRELAVPQTRYLQNAAYVRLKNLTLGYNLPQSILKKVKITAIRFYVTGQNLWTYSPMFKITRNFDPEVLDGSDPEVNSGGGDGFLYPMEKTYTLGVNVTF
jgi:TonB-linked SusC/RagA family outer membrane protein